MCTNWNFLDVRLNLWRRYFIFRILYTCNIYVSLRVMNLRIFNHFSALKHSIDMNNWMKEDLPGWLAYIETKVREALAAAQQNPHFHRTFENWTLCVIHAFMLACFSAYIVLSRFAYQHEFCFVTQNHRLTFYDSHKNHEIT